MTGYGRGLAERDGRRAIVEIRSVNHRFLDLKIRGASVEPTIEEHIKTRVRDMCKRGAVTTSVRVERHGAAAAVRVDMDVAERVHDELSRLSDRLGLAVPVSLELLCQQPGVLVGTDDEADAALIGECVSQAVQSALETLVRMRETEGALLESDLRARVERVREIAAHIADNARSVPDTVYQRLSERVGRLLESRGSELSADRLAQEVALLAERADVTEELVRLQSHTEHLDHLMAEASTQKSAVGRRLDFLVQEMGREINTIGAKSQSADTAHAVIEAKAELEKIREQVQNIE